MLSQLSISPFLTKYALMGCCGLDEVHAAGKTAFIKYTCN